MEDGASLSVGREVVGFLGEIPPRLRGKWDLHSSSYFGEIILEKLVPHLPQEKKFKEIPRYPAVTRDLSLVVDEKVSGREITNQIESLGKGLIRGIELFDLFRGGRIPKGQKNFAFRITYQSPDRTLVSEEIQQLQGEIAETLVKKFGAQFQL